MWTWSLLDATGGAALTQARNRKVRFRKRGPAEASFTIDGRHEEANAIEELVTDIVVRRDRDKLFRGRIAPTSDTVDGTRHQVAVTAGDYRALLDARLMFTGDTLAYPSSDMGFIVAAILDIIQARDGGDLGITEGLNLPHAGTTAPSSTFVAGQSAAAAIDTVVGTDLGDGGGDWEIDADLTANLYPSGRGQARGIVLHHGANVEQFTRRFDPRTYANVVRLSGASTSTVATVADIATRPEGRWETQQGNRDATTSALVTSLAARWLSEHEEIRAAYSAVLAPGFWEGPDQLWLGDTVRWVARSGRLDENFDLVVEEIEVTVDDAGREAVAVQLGWPQVESTLDVMTERRLRNLERQ